jgi:outer membrane beta-barrel protein
VPIVRASSLLCLLTLASPSIALAEEATAPPPTPAPETAEGRPKVAIQRLKYQMAHEVSLGVGIMPLDAFQKSITGSLSYTLHFDNAFAWEVFRVSAAYLTSTNLRDSLINTFAIPPEDFSAPRFSATTGIELTPIYGKLVFLNDTVVHQAFFVGLYGGVILGDRPDFAKMLSDLRPSGGAGVGYRIFFSKTVSFRVDVRDFISFKRAIRANERAETDNVLWITGAFSFNLWRDDA